MTKKKTGKTTKRSTKTTKRKTSTTKRRTESTQPTTRGGTRPRDGDSSSLPPSFNSKPSSSFGGGARPPSSLGGSSSGSKRRSFRELTASKMPSIKMPNIKMPDIKMPELPDFGELLGGKSKKGRKSKGKGRGRGRGKNTKIFQIPDISFEFDPRQKALVAGFLLLAITLVLVLSLLSTNRGMITGGAINILWGTFGWGSPAILVALALSGFWLLLWGLKSAPEFPVIRVLGAALLFLTAETFFTLTAYLNNNGYDTFDAVANAQMGGGWLGYFSAQLMMEAIGFIGSVLVLCTVGVVGAVLVSGMTWDDISQLFTPAPVPETPAVTGTVKQPPLPFWQRLRGSIKRDDESSTATASTPVAQIPRDRHEEDEEDAEPREALAAPIPAETTAEVAKAPAKQEKKKRTRRKSKKAADTPAAPLQTTTTDAPPEFLPQTDPVVLGRATAPDAPPPSWQIPTVAATLQKGSEQSADDTYIHQQALIIEETLGGFGAPAQVVDIKHGPTIIQYCVEPQYLVQKSGKRTKVKVGKIASLADDLSLALAARSVRVQAPVPGKGYVGIEVPNESKALVSLRDVMESKDFKKVGKKTTLTIGLGEDVSGNPMSIDLAKMPHMLIAGATGSGKSVCINALIACLLLQNTPEQLQLVMVDPKRVELTGYNGIPHLAAPVVVDMERVTGTLQWALREMDNRYKQFANVGSRNVTEYNKMMREKKKKQYPFIVIIIDELADLMMLAPDETEKSIARLAQMARATGIHMILATQRPSVDVVTGLIKANFPARVAFAVASSTDSRVVLDTTGAERLLGQGDMLFQSPDAPAPVRMQGCYVSDEELDEVIAYWKAEKRRAMGQTDEGQTVNRYRAATEKTSKSALDHDIWDVDSDEQKKRKDAALAQIKKDSVERAPYIPTAHSKEIRPQSDKLPNKKTAIKKAEIKKTEIKKVAEPDHEEKAVVERKAILSEHQPPLWDELREEVELAQEEAIYEKETFQDDLWDEAVDFVQSNNKASISLLQRKFRIGYTRAARLIDRMEEEQIIGPPTGNSKAREVMFTGDDAPAEA